MKDNLDFYRDYEEEQEKELEKLPVCSVCEEPIQDEFYFDIDGEIFCEDCLIDNYRKSVDDFVKG